MAIKIKLFNQQNLSFKLDKDVVGWRETILEEIRLTLNISLEKNSNGCNYKVLWTRNNDDRVYEGKSIPLPNNLEGKFCDIFNEIDTSKALAYIRELDIQGTGMQLYKEIFPCELQTFYWQRLKTNGVKNMRIRILSEEPWIPWEIVRPVEQITEDQFLCEHNFSRWLRDKDAYEPEERQIKKIKVVVPSGLDLKKAEEEHNEIKKYEERVVGLKVSRDFTHDDVMQSFETDEFDVLHISTHGRYTPRQPTSSSIDLEIYDEKNKLRTQLKPTHIQGRWTTAFHKFHPLVILNSCQSANQGFSLTRMAGWASTFIEAGASAFIGTLWSISDETAFRFTQELYSQLSIGVTLGQAVKNARIYSRTDNDPTGWLAFTLYGHPDTPLKLK